MTSNTEIFNKILDIRRLIDKYKNNIITINNLIYNEIKINKIINLDEDNNTKDIDDTNKNNTDDNNNKKTFKETYDNQVKNINYLFSIVFILIIIFIIKLISIYKPIIQS